MNVVTNLTKIVEEMHSHMVKGEDAISQVVQELIEQKERENKLSEAARELFAVNDQVSCSSCCFMLSSLPKKMKVIKRKSPSYAIF